MAEAGRFEGHESAATLLITWARSRRSTAPSPLDLFGARGPVSLPFAGDAVAEAALSVAPREKLGGELYREVLERADQRLAALALDQRRRLSTPASAIASGARSRPSPCTATRDAARDTPCGRPSRASSTSR